MKGDVINIGEDHRRVARQIVDRLSPRISASSRPFTLSVAGESGSGKSETGHAIAEEFQSRGVSAHVLQQDDYFILPPKSNDARRRQGLDWVGTDEVRLGLLDEHLAAARARSSEVAKPLIDYEADRIETETVNFANAAVVIAEGTYTSLLENLDCRVFIDRNRLQTMESRRERAREPMDPFLEKVLEIEHTIIAPEKARADVLITNEYDVQFIQN